MVATLGFNDVVSNAAKLYIDGVAAGTIGLPTLVASGAILASAGTSTPPIWANELNLFSGTKTASTPILNLTQTWNNAGVVFTGLKLNVTSTASATGSLLLDLQVAGSSRFSVDKAGGLVTSSDAYFSGDLKGILNTSKFTLGASSDVILTRDAANTLALRNGAAAQGCNIYNTYTDASNYERGLFGWGSNLLFIGTEKAGTGVARALQIRIDGNNVWQFSTFGHFLANTDNTFDIGASGANRPRTGYFGTSVSVGAGYGWLNSKGAITQAVDGQYTFSNFAGTQSVTFTVGALGLATFTGTLTSANSVWAGINSGVFIQGRSGFSSGADGTFRIQNNAGTITTDITLSGASGTGGSLATFGGGVTATLDLYAGATRNIAWSGRSVMKSSANGNIGLYDSAETSFGLLQFGGTTSSFPALKRNGAQLDVRLADDSALANLVGAALTATAFVKTNATTVAGLPSASGAGAGARSFVTDANATMAAGIGTVVVGGGSNKVPVYSDGTDWLIG